MKTAEATRLRVAESIIDLVGETPMLKLGRVVPAGAADVYAKLEYLNPGGSVKDRAAIGIIRRAGCAGLLRPGSTIVEATAGNTGIGLALIGVNEGYKVILCVPERFSAEKVKIMEALGAQVSRSPDAAGWPGRTRRAREIGASIPGSFMGGQFQNAANPGFPCGTTAQQISDQRQRKIGALVIGVGTRGT